MEFDKIVVTLAGVALIAFIYWFFFRKSENVIDAGDHVDIIVDGGYTPEAISAQAGSEITLTFLRKDPSPCLEEVVFSDFGIRRYLPLNETVEVRLTPPHKGSYAFACGMNMFHGKLVAR